MTHRNLKLTKGVFDLVGRGDGIVCPHCKNFAPATSGGSFRCQRCGAIIKVEEIGASSAAQPTQLNKGKPPMAKQMIPSGRLGKKTPEQPAPKAAEPAPEQPTVTATPAPHDDVPPALDAE